MSKTYRLSGLAKHDLIRINGNTFEENPQAANRFLRNLDRKCQLLAQFPEMGVRWPDLQPPLRSFPISKHLIFYRPVEDGIEVMRVISGYQDLMAIFPELDEESGLTDDEND